MTAPAETTGTAFVEWLDSWHADLAPVELEEIMRRAGGADRVAVVIVDLLVGFCTEGALASDRVGALGPPTARFLERLHQGGIRHFLIARDSHPPDSPEFQAFPPHCIRGTREAELIPELTALPILKPAATIRKGSINFALEPAFEEWEKAHPEISGWVVVGDCTDLCIYQAAMHLRLSANSRGLDREVWIPAELVDTYDLSVPVAREIGALPHDAEVLHRLFLYHMALNGIRVVREIRV
jgi:nicotinamidase-related amidase